MAPSIPNRACRRALGQVRRSGHLDGVSPAVREEMERSGWLMRMPPGADEGARLTEAGQQALTLASVTHVQLVMLKVAASHDVVAVSSRGEGLAGDDPRRISLVHASEQPHAMATCNALMRAGFLGQQHGNYVMVRAADGGLWHAPTFYITDTGREILTAYAQRGA